MIQAMLWLLLLEECENKVQDHRRNTATYVDWDTICTENLKKMC